MQGDYSRVFEESGAVISLSMPAQRAQYPLNKEYTLNYRGLNIMI